MKPPARAALYLRVSTRDQSVENQERELRRWADRLGFEVAAVYADTASGSQSDRESLAAVLAGAHRRGFGVLLIWSLDRLSREGIGVTARYLEQLRMGGVSVMGERVRAGLARARAQGVRFGRPARDLDLEDVRRRRAAGQAWRMIARALKIPSRTLRRRAKTGQNLQAESVRHDDTARIAQARGARAEPRPPARASRKRLDQPERNV